MLHHAFVQSRFSKMALVITAQHASTNVIPVLDKETIVLNAEETELTLLIVLALIIIMTTLQIKIALFAI
jgi:hypothetical protein